MPSFLFELSGELKSMAAAEAVKCMEAETDSYQVLGQGPGYVIGSFDGRYLDQIAERVALTHRVGRYLGSFDPDDLSGFGSIEIPEGSFAVRAKRFEGMMKDIDSQDVIMKLGGALAKHNDVNLKHPDHEIWILMSDRLHIFLGDKHVDRNILETRKVSERPFFSPISLHPIYARALINLTGAKKGDTVLDPFCGTGGLAIEAAFMGMRTIVSDFDPEMIAGTQENMDYYGLRLYDSEVCDISDITEIFVEVDRIATDPPYGRSTHTGGENIDSIYARAMSSFGDILNDGGCAGVVLPHPMDDGRLRLRDMFVQRVHKSLSRHYHLFDKI